VIDVPSGHLVVEDPSELVVVNPEPLGIGIIANIK
jgi:hypothetical protein